MLERDEAKAERQDAVPNLESLFGRGPLLVRGAWFRTSRRDNHQLHVVVSNEPPRHGVVSTSRREKVPGWRHSRVIREPLDAIQAARVHMNTTHKKFELARAHRIWLATIHIEMCLVS